MWTRWAVAAFLTLAAAAQTFTNLDGRIEPPSVALIGLHSTSTPFTASTYTDDRGRFHFNRIESGSYTVVVTIPGSGELRQTIDISPSHANVVIQVDDRLLVLDRRTGKISVRELAIPRKAVAEYQSADRAVRNNDRDSAIYHLEKAVELAPQYTAAWNHLGTIAYKAGRYNRAVECFRAALKADPDAYEPLVNLGGALINLKQLEDAWNYNVQAVARRPNDALANVQLGMTYFELGKADLALRYLNEARKLDPGHFSLPQLLVAEIYLRRQQQQLAADVIEEFLRYHPEWPKAAEMRSAVESWRKMR